MRLHEALPSLLVVSLAAAGCVSEPPPGAAARASGEAPGSGYRFGLLTELADSYGTDKGTNKHQYARIYELFFLPHRETARKIFEIGVLEGASLKMLRDYFPNATIYGIDIVDTSHLDSDRIRTAIADQSDRRALRGFIDEHGSDFDFIIDDGGHSMEQQQVSLGFLFEHVRPGGYYILEDVHTSLYPPDAGYGVEPDGQNTTLTMIESLIRGRGLTSPYMTRAEQAYVAQNIDYSDLHVGRDGQSITWIVKKKQAAPAE